MEKKTPLYDIHVAEGGKMVPFAGYLLPVQYATGIKAEHLAVREHVGLFDVSHMGEVLIEGPGALATINHLLTNDFTSMVPGRVRYGVMCNEHGGCIDDLVVYMFDEETYLVVVNAANREKDYSHISGHLLADTTAKDISDSIVQLALQGPAAKDTLDRLADPNTLPASYYHHERHVDVDGIDCLVSQTGYTGSFGYELYCVAEQGPELWQKLCEAGEEFGLIPCGLGARDTLRLEASMPLYGNEMDEEVSPLEAGLGFAVKLDKPEFIGRDALVAAGAPKRTRVGIEATSRGIIREHQDVYVGDERIGTTTSGTFCPYLKKSLAMALVDADHAAVDTQVAVDVRGRRVSARIVPMPFYKRP
jgi:aminomethyltransferase